MFVDDNVATCLSGFQAFRFTTCSEGEVCNVLESFCPSLRSASILNVTNGRGSIGASRRLQLRSSFQRATGPSGCEPLVGFLWSEPLVWSDGSRDQSAFAHFLVELSAGYLGWSETILFPDNSLRRNGIPQSLVYGTNAAARDIEKQAFDFHSCSYCCCCL